MPTHAGRIRRRCATVLGLCAVFVAAASAAEKATDPAWRHDSYHIVYDVNADGSFSQERSYTLTVLKESALADAKQEEFSYSASIQEGEVLEAWTQKKDGTRIEVPKGNYQINTAGGKNSSSPFFSDYTTVSVVFPDVAVGDQVHFAYRIREKEAIFPGQFSVRAQLSRYIPYTEADIVINTPAGMKVRHAAWNLESVPVASGKGRNSYRWIFHNPQAEKWKQEDAGVDVLADEPVVLFSTLADYRQITEAYGKRARPKAAVTARVQKLADTITADKDTAEAKTRALYEWVAKNITYGGNCIGVGAVVPRDIDVILDNRIGDCKDHATLLQALLAAVGVKSTQALINAGALYDLPEIPVVANVNHVINYLPGPGLYLDSTSPDTPYGHLPFNDAGKPVLLVDGYAAGMRTPPETGAGNEQVMTTRIKVNADGSASGDVDVGLSGVYAVIARGWFRDISADRLKDMVKYGLQKSAWHGSGEMQPDAVTAAGGGYHYRASFTMEDFLQNTDAGAFPVRPVLFGPASVWGFVSSDFSDVPTRGRVCSGGSDTETYEIEFPAGMKVLYVPRDQNFSKGGISYSVSYRLTGSTLAVTRRIHDVVEQNVCPPALLAERQQLARQVLRELRSQVLYQQGQ